jgi:predicted peptidase
MKLLLLFCLFCTYTAFCQDFSLFLKKEFTSPEGEKLPYRILYPKGYVKTKKYPLILVLHGAGERGKDNEKQLTHGSKLFLDSSAREKFPAIVVFPQCPEENYWSSVEIDRTKSPLALDFNYSRPVTEPLSLAMMLLEKLIQNESVHKKRIYITGLSMGGMGTFEAVYRYPHTFASALPICGGGDTMRYEKVNTSFWIFHGGIDAVVDVHYSRAMVRKLKQEHVDVKYTEYPDMNHNSWDSAFAEPDFLKWMLSHRLKHKRK